MPKHLRNWLIEFVINFDRKMLKHYIDTTPPSCHLKCKYPKIKKNKSKDSFHRKL